MSLYLIYDFWFIFLIVLVITNSEKISVFLRCNQEKFLSTNTNFYIALFIAWMVFLQLPQADNFLAVLLLMIIFLAIKLDKYLFFIFISFFIFSGLLGFLVVDLILILTKFFIYLVLMCTWIYMVKNNLMKRSYLL